MTMQGSATASSGWTITGQVEGNQVTAQGRVISGTTVYLVTGNGDAGSVFVPEAQYNVEAVTAAVAARAAQLDAIHNLSAPQS